MIVVPRLQLPPMYPAQRRAVMDPARIVVIQAGTKTGKTAGCLMWLTARAWNDAKPDGNRWWVAPVYPQATMAMERLERWLTQYDKKKTLWDSHASERWVRLPNGGRIWFKSADKPDGLYGEDVRDGVIDEATRCKEAAWYAVRSTVTATDGHLRIIGNVRGRKNWVYRLALKADGIDTAAYKLTAKDAVEGGILKQEAVDSARRDLPLEVFNELYMAEPTDEGANPFGIPAIGMCIQPLTGKPVVTWGVDLAKSHDWVVACGLDENRHVAKLERWQADWFQTRARLTALIGDTPALIDSTGVGDPIVEDLQRSCPCVTGFHFSSSSKQQLMDGLSVRIQSAGIGFPDGWLRDELESFEFEYSRTGVRYSAPEGMHDDGVCALALADRHFSAAARNTLRVRVF